MMRIEICGNIASGKTTLATLFKNEANILFEEYENNPFWTAFYSDPERYQFETEISFLLQHYHLVKRDFTSGEINICDYSFLLDYSYALSDLNNRELKIFEQVSQKIIDEVSPPDVLIYLKCDVEVVFNRIKARGRKEEEGIEIDFLRLIEENLEKNIEQGYQTGKLIKIESDTLDFAHNTDTQEKIVNSVLSRIGNSSLDRKST